MKTHFLIIQLLMVSFCYSQSPHPLEFFPHHQGDIFEYYWNESAHPDSFQNIITKDSLGLDGKYYLETTRFGKMSVDTTTYEVRDNSWGGPFYSNLLFKLDADSGDQWVVKRGEFATYLATVTDVFYTNWLGYFIQVKKIEQVDSASGLYLHSYYLGSKFGNIIMEYDPPGSFYYLRGAIINGVKYGTVIDIKNHNSFKPLSFLLEQNYPNPFNPATTICYTLNRSTFVELDVYNILGQKIKSLVSTFQQSGDYKIVIDADQWPSGLYIYRMKTSEGVLTKKMTLVK